MCGTTDSITVKVKGSIYKKLSTILLPLHYCHMFCHTWPGLRREGKLWHCLIAEQLSHFPDLHTKISETQKEVWEQIKRHKRKRKHKQHHIRSEHFPLSTSKTRNRHLQQPPDLLVSAIEAAFLKLSEDSTVVRSPQSEAHSKKWYTDL